MSTIHPVKRFFTVLIAVCLAATTFVLPSRSFAKTLTPAFHYQRLFYFVDSKQARQSLYAYWGSIDIFAPQSYALDNDGTLSGSVNPAILGFAHRVKLKIMPLVTNGKFSMSSAHAFLDDTQAQDRAIASLIREAKTNGYWGWQLDFEQMDASYRDRFSAFVARFSDQLHAAGLKASVAVVAQISENPEDYTNNLWQKLIGVYDYRALGQSADFVSVMSYDDPESTGPVTRFTWLADVLQYSITKIPKDKISLGIGLYYWQWNDSSGQRVGIGGYRGILTAEKRHVVTWGYATALETAFMRWRSYGSTYTLWYENARSVKAKVALIKKYRLYGFSAWALGLEVPSVYQAIGS